MVLTPESSTKAAGMNAQLNGALQSSIGLPEIDLDNPLSLSPSNLDTSKVSDNGYASIDLTDDPSFKPRSSLERDTILHKNLATHCFNAQHSLPSLHHAGNTGNGLHIRTDTFGLEPSLLSNSNFTVFPEPETHLRHSTSAASLPRRTPSIRAALAATHSSAGSLSPGSTYSSPQLAAMADITPLPSPILLGRDPWKAVGVRSRSRGSSTASKPESTTIGVPGEAIPQTSPPRRRIYHGLLHTTTEAHAALPNATKGDDVPGHARNRSLSEYVPDAMPVPKPRIIAVSGSSAPTATSEAAIVQCNMHREEYLALQRGIAVPVTRPPTPPRSNRSGYESSDNDEDMVRPPSSKPPRTEVFVAQTLAKHHIRKYKAIRQLGRGTFSKVFLAVKQVDSGDDGIDYSREGTNLHGVNIRSRRLVAVKVVEHGPAGGADEERVEVSLKREVEIMKMINHPSLVHLKAFGADEKKALLVLNFCPGGDMFEVASLKYDLLVPGLIRRIFSEMVSATRYLHQNYIVHRDIKLENVLLNIPTPLLRDVSDWRTFDRPVVTLTDLGLSRRISPPPESPLLHTRCGSEDYTAPEILMGQPYDGRSTDAWALGVLLYSIMERRLPFDPLPGANGDPAKLRSRTPHRIARCEWAWFKFADADGEWDPEKGHGLDGARICVEGLLKRVSRRKSLDEIAELEWVRDGIYVEGGLRRIEEEVL